MKALKIFSAILLAMLAVACSSVDTLPGEEPHDLFDPSTDPAAILGRWDEIGGDEYFIFTFDSVLYTGNFTHYNGEVTTGTFMFETESKTIHCKTIETDGRTVIFKINVTFDDTDKNLATFNMGSQTINVKRTLQ